MVHAYSRALRLHTLTAQSIVTVLFETPDALEGVNVTQLRQLWSQMMSDDIIVSEAMSDPVISKLGDVMSQLYQTVSCRSRTAKLWVQYVEQVSLMQQFVHAERSGYFPLHLHTIARMQPYFHALGV